MKKILLILSIAWLPMQSISAQDYLNVIRVNDPVQSFRLDNINKLTFDMDNVYIEQLDNSPVEFPFSDIVMLTFLNSSVISLEELLIQNKSNIDVFYSIMLDNATVKSSSPIKRITVYNTLGRVVKELKPNALQAEVSLRDTPQGLYIISAVTVEGNVSKKIIKQ
ncbi:MAG: T9SS type A sorting domain-containing protein [Bacteroidales bacterium]|jgi:hypothetical protein|nr:T9SS type A sorting domain-containing protein [Bacteroidales bacterium]